jgi:hypothetical protein
MRIRRRQGSPAPSSRPARGSRRDPVIDLWRGLALVDMAWVHLVHNFIVLPGSFAPIIRDHTRFAAGAFVFLAGLSVASTFGEALARGGSDARAVRGRLWRRALLLVVLDRILCVGIALLNQWRAFLPGGEDPLAPLLPLLSLREPGVTGGLLILYAVLLAMTPALVALARRIGWSTIGVSSAVVYGVAICSGETLHWPPWAFPIAFWQPLFVGGLLSVPLLNWIRSGGPRRAAGWAAFASTLFAALMLVRSGALGIEISESAFAKVPLRPGELVRYVIATQLLFSWSALAFSSSARMQGALGWLCLIGRNSLLVYAAHIFVEVPIVEYAWGANPPAWAGLVLLAIDALALVAIAGFAEFVDRRGSSLRAKVNRVPFASAVWFARAGTVGVLVAVASLLSLRAVQLAVRTSPAAAIEHAAIDDSVPDERLMEPAATSDPISSPEDDESAEATGV